MLENENRINAKSFFYNLVKNDYYVYRTDEYNKFLIEKLICTSCKKKWNTSLKECFICGTENYHVYTCTNCNNHISITRANIGVCDNCGENNSFSQLCINPRCLTNTNKVLQKKVVESGGVFANKGGFSIRQNSCKNCGGNENKYVSSPVVVVENKSNLVIPYSVYIERDTPVSPAKAYWIINSNNQEERFTELDELVKYQLDL